MSGPAATAAEVIRRSALRQAALLQASSIIILFALPVFLLLPGWRDNVYSRELNRHLESAIYRFSSKAMPQCDQFVHPMRPEWRSDNNGTESELKLLSSDTADNPGSLGAGKSNPHTTAMTSFAACQTRRSGFSV